MEASISRSHKLLASNFTSLVQSRDLNAKENALLLQLERGSSKYKQLAGVIAIESYLAEVVALLAGCEPILEIVAILLEQLREARSRAREEGI